MILNSAEEKSLESLLADKGIINVIGCGKCKNFVAFEEGDIVYINQLIGTSIYQTIGEKGYIKCPWCGNEIFVAERQKDGFDKIIVRKYYYVIEGEKYDEVNYERKNGKSVKEFK